MMNTVYQPVSMEQALVARVSHQELTRWTEESALPYRELMACYRCAAASVRAMLETAEEEYALRYERNLLQGLETEIMTPEAILDRIMGAGLPLTAGSIEQRIDDIAVLRARCFFQSDVYELADALLRRGELTLLKKDDFIAHPRPEGYRGLHLLASVPVTLNGQKRRMKVELRFLTPAMALWAEAEETLRTKAEPLDPEQVAAELRACAGLAAELDERLEQVRYNVQHRVIAK